MAGHEPNERLPAVAARLRLTRKAFGMKKAAWCKFVGISPQSWGHLEGTRSLPARSRISIDQALQICRVTGIDLDWIFRGHRDRLAYDVRLKIEAVEQAEASARSGHPEHAAR
jgi:DNA-binding XRE family transcriptional regulator